MIEFIVLPTSQLNESTLCEIFPDVSRYGWNHNEHM